jgi:hypothetical protein
VPRRSPLAGFPRLGAPSKPRWRPKQPSLRPLIAPIHHQTISRAPPEPRRSTSNPGLYYGEATVRLRRRERAAGDAVPTHSTNKTSRNVPTGASTTACYTINMGYTPGHRASTTGEKPTAQPERSRGRGGCKRRKLINRNRLRDEPKVVCDGCYTTFSVGSGSRS